jgi:hypothetical protein
MIEYSYLDDAEEEYNEFSKYYNGSFDEFIKMRVELVNKYDITYFAPYGLNDSNIEDIILTT